MSNDVYDSYILELKNICPDNFCDEVIRMFESDTLKKRDETSKNGLTTEPFSFVDGFLTCDIPEQKQVAIKMETFMKKALIQYSNMCIKNNIDVKMSSNPCTVLQSYFKLAKFTLSRLTRYTRGHYFNWHSDVSTNGIRLLGCILYLNDMEDGDGGNTTFISGRSIKPEKGKMLLFPSQLNYIHKGEPVERGVKYIFTSFLTLPNQNNMESFIPLTTELPFMVTTL